MSELRVASRYAKSLLDLSVEQHNLEEIIRDITFFKKVYEEQKPLQMLLKSPIIPGDKKNAILKQLFERSFHKNTLAFFDVIIRKKREYFLHSIAAAFIDQYNELNKIISATVKTAVAIDSNTTK